MSGMVRRPWEKTIALGGVATGIMKANDVEMAALDIRYSGFTWSLTAWSYRINTHVIQGMINTHE